MPEIEQLTVLFFPILVIISVLLVATILFGLFTMYQAIKIHYTIQKAVRSGYHSYLQLSPDDQWRYCIEENQNNPKFTQDPFTIEDENLSRTEQRYVDFLRKKKIADYVAKKKQALE